MGRIQIAKINGGSLNPPYRYSTSPSIRTTDGFYAPSNTIITQYNPARAFRWEIGPQSSDTETNIAYNDVNTIEVQVKFSILTAPASLCELFSLCSIFTPDMDTDGYFKFWDNGSGSYWLTYPFYGIYGQWAYMKLNYDKATYTQTWSISYDGTNFILMGTHTEDRNSEIGTNWDSSDVNNFMLGAMGTNDGAYLSRMNTVTYIDLSETYMKVNGNIICQGILEGS